MEQKTIFLTVFLVVLLVAVVAFVGLTKEITGLTYQTTTSLSRSGCVCEIEVYGSSGNILDYSTQHIRTRNVESDESCTNRCEMLHGRSSDRKVVHAYANV